jgi:hypothetical protein
MANRYRTKTLQGLQSQYFVTSADEPGDSDFETFVTSGSEGELSAFNAAGTRFAGHATPSDTANIQLTDKYFIAQIIDGKVKRSQLLNGDASSWSTKAAAAGTKHKIVITSIPTPVVDDPMEITIIETTPSQEPFPTWFYDHRATSTDSYVQLGIIVGFINDPTNKANQSDGVFVNADVLTAEAGGTFGAGTETLAVTNASTAMTASADVSAGLSADDYIKVDGSIYKIVTIGTTDIVVDRPYAGVTDAAVANASLKDLATTAGTLSLELEAINLNEHFTVVQPAVWVDNPTTVTVTAFVKTSGTVDQVLEFESEGDVWEGYRTANRAFGEDFGKPTSQVTVGDTYDIHTIKYLTKQKSVMAPIAEDKHVAYVSIAASHANMKTYLGQIFANL